MNWIASTALILLIFTLFFCVSTGLAQLTAKPCPKLEVIGPQGIMFMGQPETFVLRSDQDFPEQYQYEWSAENGRVVSGQGTRAVEIVTGQYGVNVTAIVKVRGLPSGCETTASEIAGSAPHVGWEILDEWGNLPSDDQRCRMDMFFVELANNPDHMGLLIIKVGKKEHKNAEARRMRLILDHVRFRKFDRNRLDFCIGRGLIIKRKFIGIRRS